MEQIPYRREWRGINSSQIINNSHTVFGYTVTQMIIPKDSSLVIVSKNAVARENSPNRTLYVRGLGKVENDGQLLDPRTAGMYSGDRPEHPAGTTKVTAIEELELWCFNWHANRGRLPTLTPLRLVNTESYTPASGTKILVCYGGIDDCTAAHNFTATGETLSVQGNTYGFIFS